MQINTLLEDISNKYEKVEIVISEKIKNYDDGLKKYNSLIDARSLAFFTLGRSNVLDKNIIAVVDSNEISSVLTAMTEAKYQHQKMIIIAIGQAIYTDVYEDVTDNIYTIDDLSQIQNIIEESMNKKTIKPILINIQFQENEQKDKYQNILEELLNKILENDHIYTNINTGINNQKLIKWTSEYCGITRYLGILAAESADTNFFFTTYTNVIKDINAFYTRFVTDKVKVFYLKEKNTNINFNIKAWSNANNINFLQITSKEQLKDLKPDTLKNATLVEIIV